MIYTLDYRHFSRIFSIDFATCGQYFYSLIKPSVIQNTKIIFVFIIRVIIVTIKYAHTILGKVRYFNKASGFLNTCAAYKMSNIYICARPGTFCSLTYCDMGYCVFGECLLAGSNGFECKCQYGYMGRFCDEKIKPCELNPCKDRGDCISLGDSDYQCRCYAYWTGEWKEKRI